MRRNTITDVPGIKAGHWTESRAATGCTVLLCERPMVGGCFIAGAAPGTRETALLDPTCLVEEVHALLLAGGSAFGLDAAGGVMRFLEEHGIGFETKVARVPIVPAAILFDLGIGDPSVRPNAEAGYIASRSATAEPVTEGNVGAGTGATVGKVSGPAAAMKGGLGSSAIRLTGGVVVGALAAVNCVGDVVDQATNEIVAGARPPDGVGFLDAASWLRTGHRASPIPGTNTTLAVVATNARLSKGQANRLALLAYQGMARAVRPLTANDGDVVFALASRRPRDAEAELSMLGSVAAEALAQAIVRGVKAAKSLCGYPGYADMSGR